MFIAQHWALYEWEHLAEWVTHGCQHKEHNANIILTKNLLFRHMIMATAFGYIGVMPVRSIFTTLEVSL